MNRNKLLCSMTAAVAIMAGTAQASSLDNNKVLRDSNNNVVHSLAFGTCVRTGWEAGKDVCAPAPAPQRVVQAAPPRPAEIKRTTLTTAEKTVYFKFDSAELTPEAESGLKNVATKLRTASDIKNAEIVGYADSIGSNSYNRSLSEERAEAVKSYLASQGYLNTRVAEVRGLGEKHPVSNCSDNLSRSEKIACKSHDRRVELEIKYEKTKHYSQAQ